MRRFQEITQMLLILLLISWFLVAKNTTTDFEYEIYKLTKRSEYIVRGESVSFKTHYTDDKRSIYTDLEFKVTQVLKGELKSSVIIIALPAGSINGKTMYVLDSPSFALNEEAILFLRKFKDENIFHSGKYAIFALSSGKYNIYGGSTDDQKLVITDSKIGNFRCYPGEAIDYTQCHESISMLDFIALVKQYVKE